MEVKDASPRPITGRVTRHIGPHPPRSRPLHGPPVVPEFESHIPSVASEAAAATWAPQVHTAGIPRPSGIWDGTLHSRAPGSASIAPTVPLAACLLPAAWEWLRAGGDRARGPSAHPAVYTANQKSRVIAASSPALPEDAEQALSLLKRGSTEWAPTVCSTVPALLRYYLI